MTDPKKSKRPTIQKQADAKPSIEKEVELVTDAAKQLEARLVLTRIEGKVAELLTERDLVLNVGSDQGVTIGMRFKIINPRGTEIRDPDTGNPLGSVELTKVVVKVVSVQEKLSVARTFQTIEVPPSGILGMSAWSIASVTASMGTTGGTRVETLRSDERFAQEDMDESQSYVKRGDPAVQIIGEDDL